MNGYSKILSAVTLMLLATGCRSPMQTFLDRVGPWEQAAKRMVSEREADPSGLVFKVFPDLNDPLHLEIWKALRKQNKVGDGYGTICRYYGGYLITVSVLSDHGRSSSFYHPKTNRVLAGNEDIAFFHYRGDLSATEGNILRLVATLLATRSYPTYIVENSQQIPHSKFEKNNPTLSFAQSLEAKGITIRPVKILSIDEHSELGGYSECCVFAYQPCGGLILRYDVTCQNGRIVSCKSYELVSGAGDCWFIM